MDAADTRAAQVSRIILAHLERVAKTQLEMGIEIEKEHADVYDALQKEFERLGSKMPVSREKFFELVARAHIRELPDYYTRLKKMEEGMSEKEAMDFSELNSIIQPGRSLTRRELARALRMAITAEHDAVHLYELIADSTTDTFVRKVLQDVANEEKVHVGEFEKVLSVIDVQDTEFVEEGKDEVEDMIEAPKETPIFVQTPIHTALR